MKLVNIQRFLYSQDGFYFHNLADLFNGNVNTIDHMQLQVSIL